jgi:hypothetical protein
VKWGRVLGNGGIEFCLVFLEVTLSIKYLTAFHAKTPAYTAKYPLLYTNITPILAHIATIYPQLPPSSYISEYIR